MDALILLRADLALPARFTQQRLDFLERGTTTAVLSNPLSFKLFALAQPLLFRVLPLFKSGDGRFQCVLDFLFHSQPALIDRSCPDPPNRFRL